RDQDAGRRILQYRRSRDDDRDALHGGRDLCRLRHSRGDRPDDRVPGRAGAGGRAAGHRNEAEAARGDRPLAGRERPRRDVQGRLTGPTPNAAGWRPTLPSRSSTPLLGGPALALFDVAADARGAFDALKAGGIAIVPNDIGYSILGGSGAALRRIFAAKGRAPTKLNAMVGNRDIHRELHRCGARGRDIVQAITEDYDLPLGS